MSEDGNSRSKIQLVILVLLLLGILVFLVRLVIPKPYCGNDQCDGKETALTCPKDCQARCGDETCNGIETPASCPEDCEEPEPGPEEIDPPLPVLPAPTPDVVILDVPPPPPPDVVTRDVAPPDVPPVRDVVRRDVQRREDSHAPPPDAGGQPEGACEDPALRGLLREIVQRCEQACVGNTPLVQLSQAEFVQLLAHPNDEGYATHFVLFGCNQKGRTDCVGFHSEYTQVLSCLRDFRSQSNGGSQALRTCYGGATTDADKLRCLRDHPPKEDSKLYNCARYARVIEDEFGDFLSDNRNMERFVFFGTASKTGNDGDADMSDDNKRLATRRAGNASELWATLSDVYEVRSEKAFQVVLDNTKHRFNNPKFMEIINDQIAGYQRGDERGFNPTGTLAVNRSVMVLAFRCDLGLEKDRE